MSRRIHQGNALTVLWDCDHKLRMLHDSSLRRAPEAIALRSELHFNAAQAYIEMGGPGTYKNVLSELKKAAALANWLPEESDYQETAGLIVDRIEVLYGSCARGLEEEILTQKRRKRRIGLDRLHMKFIDAAWDLRNGDDPTNGNKIHPIDAALDSLDPVSSAWARIEVLKRYDGSSRTWSEMKDQFDRLQQDLATIDFDCGFRAARLPAQSHIGFARALTRRFGSGATRDALEYIEIAATESRTLVDTYTVNNDQCLVLLGSSRSGDVLDGKQQVLHLLETLPATYQRHRTERLARQQRLI